MHQLMCTNNRIDGACAAAMGAADAERFIDNCNVAPRSGLFDKREYVFAKQAGEALHGFVPARRAEIDRNTGLDDGNRIRPAARVTTLRALRLWQ
jgi:hypothetical protein